MPTSDNRTISPVLHKIIGIMPASILDLGIGYGKYGVLCREYVDFNREPPEPRYKANWRVFILGIEGFEGYRTPAWEMYSQVRIEDFADRDNWHYYTDFDVVLLLDSLEHIPENDGSELLAFLRSHNKHVIIAAPEGEYPQGAENGNELERHRSSWTTEVMQSLGAEVFYRGECCFCAHFKGGM